MSRRRWIADEVSGNQAALVGDHAHHLARVLRAQVGQKMDIVVGGVVRRGVITSVRDDRIELELAEEITASASPDVSLLLAIFKFDRLEWAIEKCTELGVRRIVPVITRRTDTHLAAAASKRVERWQRLVQQASEQSRRVDVPEISHPVQLKDAVREAATLRLLLAETEKQRRLRDALEANRASQSLLLAIGPEGGWTEDEIAMFTREGWISTSLGETILRAETAAISATAIAFSVLS